MNPVEVDTLYDMVYKYVKGFWSKLFFNRKSWFFDTLYYPIEYNTFKQLLEEYKKPLSGLSYKYEVFDCDDFAEFFAVWMKLRTGTNGCGVALGTYNGGGHAWNVCLVNDGKANKVVFVEPQSGEEISVNGNYKLKAVIW